MSATIHGVLANIRHFSIDLFFSVLQHVYESCMICNLTVEAVVMLSAFVEALT